MNFRQSAIIRMIGSRRALQTETPGNIDECGFVDGEPGLFEHVSGSDVPGGAPYFVRGWAIDLGRKQKPWAIAIEIDGKTVPARVLAGQPRRDIARLFGSPLLASSGFTAFVETKSLAAGPHELRIRAVVGRYGAAFARLPTTVRFFILKQLATALAPPSTSLSTAKKWSVQGLSPVSAGSTLVLNGSACDDRERPFAVVAAQIGDGPWSQGWRTGGGSFCIRVRLHAVEPGLHRLRMAGQTREGIWMLLGGSRELTVASAPKVLSRWAGTLIESGEAIIVDESGERQSRITVYRVRSPVSIAGILRRRSPIGLPVTLVARSSGGVEASLPAWSAPTDDPQRIMFGAEIGARELRPDTYRLFVDAPDRTQRFVGRADTGCDLVVERRPSLAAGALTAG